jgi:hypothetical protein
MTWQPTWQRLVASALVLFALALAVLVWRVQAGADPALGATRSATQSQTQTQTQTQSQQQVPQSQDFSGGVAPSTHQS